MKKKTINWIIGFLFVVLFLSEAIYSFKHTNFSKQQSGQTIQIVHNPYETEIASANVLSLVLEEAGFNVRLVSVDNAIMYESIATGQSDAMTAAWLPTTHGTTYAEYEDRLDNLGPNLEGAEAGLAVPDYMDVDSIADLTDEADQTIMSIEPGAGVTVQTEEAMNLYDNLHGWKLESPSTGAMLASVESAVKNQEEIIVSAWTPHWMFDEYGLKMLDDPQVAYGEAENIYTLARKGLKEDHPKAYQIIDNFYWDIEDMDSVTHAMATGADDRSAAKQWIENNRQKVDSWLEGVYDEE